MRFPVVVLLVATAAIAAPAVAFDAEQRAAIREEVRAFLLENPGILRDMVRLLEAEEASQQSVADRDLVARHAEALFDDGFSHVSGNPEGDVTIVEFIDYQCGFCRRAHPEVQALLERDGAVRLVTKEFPILGPGSELASRAALATLIAEGPEAYERLGHALFSRQGPINEASLEAALRETGIDPEAIRAGMEADTVTDRLRETRALATSMGIQGTPTFVIEDRLVRGYLPLADMEAVVAAARGDRAGE